MFKFINIIIRISLIFLICLVWIRYFIDQIWLVFLYTSLLTISIELIIHFISSKRKSQKSLKNEETKLAEQISTTFIFSPDSAINYFYNLSKINYCAKKLSKYIVITDKKQNDLKNEIIDKNIPKIKEINKTILYPYYFYSQINPQNLVDILKNIEKQKATKLIICGYKIDSSTYKLAQKIKDIKIILLNSNDCFSKLIKPYNFYPQNLKNLTINDKLKFKDILKLSISRKNSKGYFIASLLLLFSSFVVRLNIYYVVMSSVLLLLSLLSLFLPQNSQKFEENIL